MFKIDFNYYIYISAIQVDYDFSFPEETLSSAALTVPFQFTGARDSFTIAMWVQYAQKDEPGIFFTLYSVTLVQLNSN